MKKTTHHTHEVDFPVVQICCHANVSFEFVLTNTKHDFSSDFLGKTKTVKREL